MAGDEKRKGGKEVMTILISAFSNINVGSNSRTLAIYNHIDGEKTVITTDFNHGRKLYYEPEEMSHPDQIILHVPAYKKNLSLKRILSHIVFARKVKKYLYSLTDKPTAVYCAMPTSYAAFICAKYCKLNGIKFIIDVIDLWPDSLLPLVKGKAIIKAFLFPWSYLTKYAYRQANVIMGESVKYVNEAKKYNTKASAHPIYLGVDADYIKKVKENNVINLEKPDGEIWIAYAGSLGVSYDFDTLLNAVYSIHDKYKYKLWFIGDGVQRNKIEKSINEKGLSATITGFVSHDQLLSYLAYCDIAVNIFRENTKVVYSYKFNDYVAMDCFVLNSLAGETADMVDEYKIGRNFNFRDQRLSVILSDTLNNWEYYSSSYKGNSQRLINEKLDKEKIYSEVRDIIRT